jgi:uncharacterized membrane protein YgcG
MRPRAALLIAVLPCLGAISGWAARAVPPAPPYQVLDEAGALAPETRQALDLLLAEHARATGEQVLVGVFRSLEGEDPAAFADRVFAEWRVGARNREGNGVLLMLDAADRGARLKVSYGLQPLLGERRVEQVVDDHLLPTWRRDGLDRAARAAALEILTDLESPLVSSGKAQEILGALPMPAAPARSSEDLPQPGVGWAVAAFLIGLLPAAWVLNWLSHGDAHYSSRGWIRPRPWEQLAMHWSRRARRGARGQATRALGGAHGAW